MRLFPAPCSRRVDAPFPAPLFRETHDYLKLDLKGQESIHGALLVRAGTSALTLPPILPKEGGGKRLRQVPNGTEEAGGERLRVVLAGVGGLVRAA